ncbi:autotransporter outer membrane beta-barrel domain-containing protein [Humidesulfovibrio idahonensis]
MKRNMMFALVCLLALIVPVGAHAGNTTSEESKSLVTSNIAQTSSAVNLGMVATRITSLTTPGTFTSGISGGGFAPSGGGFGAPGGAPGGGSGGGAGGTSGGRSSGNEPAGIDVWALGGSLYLDNSKSGGSYDGTLSTAMVGLDKRLGDLIIGLGFGYERLNLTTKYNSGNMDYDGLSIMPYLSYSFTKDLVADAALSYTWLNYTMKDTQSDVKYQDSMVAARTFASVGLTKYLVWDKFLLSGRVGSLYLNENQGSYTLKTTGYGKSDIYLWQGNLGVRGTFDLGNFKPFVGATYSHDLLKSGNESVDLWGTDFDLGFNYTVTDRMTLGLTGTYGIRENLTKAGGLMNFMYQF